MKVIFAFGDSITYGVWGPDTSGWSGLLRRELDREQKYYFYSLGIPGETSRGLRDRFAREVAARQRSDDDGYVFLIACGANDATWLNGEQRFKQTQDEYAANMTAVIDEAKRLGGEVLLLNITPVNEEFSREFKGKDKSCLNEYVVTYNRVLAQVAAETEVRLIDVNRAFQERNVPALLTQDGLHPNDEGHRVLFETVTAHLNR